MQSHVLSPLKKFFLADTNSNFFKSVHHFCSIFFYFLALLCSLFFCYIEFILFCKKINMLLKTLSCPNFDLYLTCSYFWPSPWCFNKTGFIKKRIIGVFTIITFQKKENMIYYSYTVARIYIVFDNLIPIKNLYDTLRIWLILLKKSLLKNFIFCAVIFYRWQRKYHPNFFHFMVYHINSVKKLTIYYFMFFIASQIKPHTNTLS